MISSEMDDASFLYTEKNADFTFNTENSLFFSDNSMLYAPIADFSNDWKFVANPAILIFPGKSESARSV